MIRDDEFEKKPKVTLPIGKAIIAVEVEMPINDKNSKYVGDENHKDSCDECFFDQYFTFAHCNPCKHFMCGNKERNDRKTIIYKLIDLPN